MQDLRFAWRIAVQNRASSLAAFVALSLGVAITTAVFSVFYGVVLRPLPFRAPNRAVALFNVKGRDRRVGLSLPDYFGLRRGLTSFQTVGIYYQSQANLVVNGSPVNMRLLQCDAPFFDVFGIPMARGRNFVPEEDQPGREFETVLSWSTWQDYFGGSEDIVGRKIDLDGKLYTVVGILPKDFNPIGRMQLLVPISYDLNLPANHRGYRIYFSWARLRDGVSIGAANGELAAFSQTLASQFPKEDGGVSTIAVNLRETMIGDVRPMLLSLFIAVCCVLLMACGNVSGLLLARATARRQEMAVRIAMGASAWRLARQLLTESVLLSTAAGLAGLAGAAECVSIVSHLQYANIPHAREILLDWHAAAFAIAAAVITGLFFGLAPAVQASTQQVNDVLKQSSQRSTETRAHQQFRQGLIFAQTATASVLLIGAGLLIHSYVDLSSVRLGFDPGHVLILNFSLSTARYKAPGAQTAFVDQVREKVRSVPGVDDAAFANNLPFNRVRGGGPIAIQGRSAPATLADAPDVLRTRVTSNYFSVMRVPLERGRFFDMRDRAGSVPVILINHTLSQRFFPGENAVGKQLRFLEQPVWREIAGIVGDAPQGKLENPIRPEVFTPYAQDPDYACTLLVRVKGEPLEYLNVVKAKVKDVDPGIAGFGLRQTLDQQLDDALGWRRFITSTLSVFSTVGVILAAIGIYALILYSVEQRRPEIGIRMALGAQKRHIQQMMIRQGMQPAIAGTVVGLLLSVLAARALSGLLYGVKAIDWITYLATATLLMAVSFLASYLPAARAASIDPNAALRNE